MGPNVGPAGSSLEVRNRVLRPLRPPPDSEIRQPVSRSHPTQPEEAVKNFSAETEREAVSD